MELFSSISTSKYNIKKGILIQRIYLSGSKVTHLLGGYFKKEEEYIKDWIEVVL